RGGMQRTLVVEQVFDHALQLDRVLAQDRHYLALRGSERSRDLVAQQLGAFAQRGKRRLQVVRQVLQKAVLLGRELGEAPPQRVEPLAQRSKVARPADFDRPL